MARVVLEETLTLLRETAIDNAGPRSKVIVEDYSIVDPGGAS